MIQRARPCNVNCEAAEPMPKALIVGTSNSVRGSGYVKHLGDQLGGAGTIRNASLGASASTHVIRSLQGIDFADYDYCVIDLSVNEDVLLRAGAMEAETSRLVVDAVVGAALAVGCLPIMLILPRRLQCDQAPEGLPLHLEHARRWSLPVFNGYGLLDHLRSRHEVTDDDLFRNSAHIDNWVAAIVGYALADYMLEGCDSRWGEGETVRDIPVLGEAPVHGPHRPGVERSTSKFSGAFVQVRAGEVLKVQAGEVTGVLGLAVNLAETHGIVRLVGDGEVLMDLRNRYFHNPDHPLVISSMPLSRLLKPDAEGMISISVLSAEALEAGARLNSAVEELGESEHTGPAQLEIEAIQGVTQTRSATLRTPHEELQADIFAGRRVQLADVAAAVYRNISNPDDARAKVEAKRQKKLVRKQARRQAKRQGGAARTPAGA